MNPAPALRAAAVWLPPYAALLLLVVWSRTLEPVHLAVAAGILILAYFGWIRKPPTGRGDWRVPAVLVLLTIALCVGGFTAWRLHRIATDWQRMSVAAETRAAEQLGRGVSDLIARGRTTATLAARLAENSPEETLFAELTELCSRSAVSAVAVFDSLGELNAWAGEHRGPLPPASRALTEGIAYSEGPLFSYLYFAEPVRGTGGHALAAVLMQAQLGLREGEANGFANAFAASTGVRPFFAPGPARHALWELSHVGETLANVRLELPSQAETRRAVSTGGRRVVLAFSGMALLVMISLWFRSGIVLGFPTTLPLLALLPPLGVAPLGAVLASERAFSPGLFLFPIAELPLGRLVALLLPLAALAATVRPPAMRSAHLRLALPVAAVAVAIGFATLLRLLLAGASEPLLEAGSHLWSGVLPAGVLVLASLAVLAMPVAQDPAPESHSPADEKRRSGTVLIAIGLVSAAAFAVAIVAHGGPVSRLHGVLPAVWALAFLPLAWGVARHTGRASGAIRWLAAGWLAFTAVAPQLWLAHVDARMAAAERELDTLGTRPDPFLEYLLLQFGVEAQRHDARGERGRDLLYRAWLGSGLAREAYPARITLWSGEGVSAHELALAGAVESVPVWDAAPPFLVSILRRAGDGDEPLVESVQDVPGVNKVMAVPLEGGRAITVVIPPRKSLDRTTVLGPFLGIRRKAHTTLTLVPAMPQHDRTDDGLLWRPTEEGWRTDMLVRYPEGDYHAYLDLRLPSLGVRLARGALLLALSLGVLAMLGVVGRAARGDTPRPPGGWTAWLQSFRARVTIALFAFFLAPCILFGWTAYRAVAGEVARTTRLVAERAAAQAVAAFPAAGGSLHSLSAHTGEETLYYFRGELAGASSPAVFEMGLFGAWMPPAAYLALTSGEAQNLVSTLDLAGRPYLVAYRRLPVAGTLGVPVWLAAGEAALRQREMAHLVLFAALMGGLFSLGLSVSVGRALARPIGRMRFASGLVGAGRLRVQLPENRSDEFGELFSAFNSMVRRLRDARVQELRTARVLAWGEVARQVAHEIKNPLTPVKLSVQHLQRAYLDQHPDFRQILDVNVKHILAEIDRLSEIARVFSRFGAPASPAGPLEAVDVGAVVSETLTLYRAGDPGVRFLDEIEPDLPPAAARPGELKEVVLNLLENARTALDGEGAVLLAVRRTSDTIEMIVKDDGVGIAPELLTRIFDPHFSTRSSGTGLGLAIVRLLVESWGGRVNAESEPASGTTLRVEMPLAETISESDR